MDQHKPTGKLVPGAGPRPSHSIIAMAQGKPTADSKQPENVRARPRGRWYALCTLAMIAIAGALVLQRFRSNEQHSEKTQGVIRSTLDSVPTTTGIDTDGKVSPAEEVPLASATATDELDNPSDDERDTEILYKKGVDTDGKVSPAEEVTLANSISWDKMDNPSEDGWDTEVLHKKAKKQLKKLGQLLVQPQRIENDILESIATPDFSSGPLVPAQLKRVFEDSVFVVQRTLPQVHSLNSTDGHSDDSPTAFRGPAGLAEALHLAGAHLVDAEDVHFKFKVIRVHLSPDGFTTHQFLSVSGRNGDAVVEQHATWIVRWRDSDGTGSPKIERIDVQNFESVETKGPLFADCTEAVLSHNDCYHDQLLYGVSDWMERMSPRDFAFSGMPGIALGDVNGDGLEDLYLCQEARLPNRLFLQNSDGTLRDVAQAWDVDWLERSHSALLVDLDNDGDQDLAVAIFGGLVVASNEDHQRFQIQTVLQTSDKTSSLSAIDFDLDGRLDLYVCGYSPNTSTSNTDPALLGGKSNAFVWHDANNGATNSLFRNETTRTGWRFNDVTRNVGLDQNNHRWSFSAAWEDYDNDGDPDLYVSNDFGRNNLYRNDLHPPSVTNGGTASSKGDPGKGRRFVDVAAETGSEDSASGMSVTWGDYDRDGWMDLYISNMFSAAGNRITFQSKFKPEVSKDLRRRFQHFARGNTLLRNLGNPSGSSSPGFSDVSTGAGVTMGRWAWGSNFIDLNNDGWEDLMVANGYATAEDTGDL